MDNQFLIGKGKKIFRPDPSKSVGKGGEADVYDIGGGLAAKIFKAPDHPDYDSLLHEQREAKRRIAEHQKKLLSFPTGLPQRMVAPQELIFAPDGTVAGYTMSFKKGAEVLLQYSDINFRRTSGLDELVVRTFKDLCATLYQAHSKVVMGDLNDLNILVLNGEAYIIDVDSSQFGTFLTHTFTERYVDPLLVREKTTQEKEESASGSLILARPHNELSDWYAFSVMLMQTLLCLAGGPYGGVYKPKNLSKKITEGLRPLRRITVFDPEVRYPKPSRHFGVLPDDLLEHFHQVFEKDKREAFPPKLLENLNWVTCVTCNTLHARGVCPKCQVVIPKAVTAVSIGTVSGERVFRTDGQIIFAVSQDGTLRWLFHHNGEYRREDNSVVAMAELNPRARFRISSQNTVIANDGYAFIFNPRNEPKRITVDTFGLLPVIDANEKHIFWAKNGQIKSNSNLGGDYQETIGETLPQQTLFWTGANMGFGFYRAGDLSQCFIFNTERRGINDSLTLKPFRGQLIDSTCFFGKEKIWFFVSCRTSGKTINSCFLIRHDGTVEAQAETEANDGSWLGTLRGKCVVGDFILSATDDGIVRVKALGNSLAVEKEFPDSARFVHTGRHLFIDRSGLMVVGSHEIWRLAIR